ncbi:hypothetical protein IPZ68_22805 [Streptomyces arenae]|nr:hypothetical protein [Streptomyces arenae]
MNEEEWVEAVRGIGAPGVRAALVVQCDLDWLRPHRLALRNAVDEVLIDAQMRNATPPRIIRVLLHNLPAAATEGPEGAVLAHSFAEWNRRLATSAAMLTTPSPHVQRLIIEGRESSASLPDMVDVLEGGRWRGTPRTEAVLRIVEAPGATTPLTGYDVNLDGPFSDVDPSVHM